MNSHLWPDGKKGFALCSTHFSRMAFAMKLDIYPVNIGFLGAVGGMLQTDCITDLVEQYS
jgi:hypothetical protein